MGSLTWSAQAFLVEKWPDFPWKMSQLGPQSIQHSHSHTHTHTHTHSHSHTHTHTHTPHTPTQTHTHTQWHTHVHMHAYTRHWHHHHTTSQAGTHTHTPHAFSDLCISCLHLSLSLSGMRAPVHTIYTHMHACKLVHTCTQLYKRQLLNVLCFCFLLSQNMPWMYAFCCHKIYRRYMLIHVKACAVLLTSDSWSWSVLYWTEDPLSHWR